MSRDIVIVMDDFSSAPVFDRRTFDPDGRLTATKSVITAAQINPYLGRELPDFDKLGLDGEKLFRMYRDPAALKKALPLFNGIPLLIEHSSVSADDPKPQLQVGTVHSCEWRDRDAAIVGTVSIWDGNAIRGIESGLQRELSAGYRFTARMVPGTVNGESFDGLMLDIIPQHVALVAQGRVSGAAVADSMPRFHTASVLDQIRAERDRAQHERENSPLARLFPNYYRLP